MFGTLLLRGIAKCIILSVLLPASIAPLHLNAQTQSNALKQDALTHMQAGRYGEALQLLNNYLSQNPNAADGYNLRGICYENRSQLANSVADLRRAVQLNPDNREFSRNLARVEKTLQSSIEKKIEGYKRELARNPDAARNYKEIAESFAELDNWNEAERWYDEYHERTQLSPDELLRYCEILAHNNQLAKGEKILQQYTERYAQSSSIWSRYGYFLLWLGKFSTAAKAFEKALALAPEMREAVEGIRLTKERSSKASVGTSTKETRLPEYAIDRYARVLRASPKDDETRFRLVDELAGKERFGEALRHLDTLQLGSADSVRVQFARLHVDALRDSLYHQRIQNYAERLSAEPADKDAALQASALYAELQDYENAMKYQDMYLAGIPENEAHDVRFKYAQYAAWGKEFDKALARLEPLLAREPNRMEYQLLRGQIAVWSVKDLALGQRVLMNVYRSNPTNATVILALASCYALQGIIREAGSLLNRAKLLDAHNKDIPAVQALYDNAVLADQERVRFAILTEARQLTQDGECSKALKKYDEYLSSTLPSKAILIEYAGVQTCAKNLDKAIAVYDKLLESEYDFDVSVLRAKNLLWKRDSSALAEFSRLVAERPTDFTAKLFLGNTHQSMQNFSQARRIYTTLLDSTNNPEERKLVEQSMSYMPPTGLIGELGHFPTHIAVAPPYSYYSDNQNFQMSTYGGRFEVGVIRTVSLGASFLRSDLRSSRGRRQINGLKGQIFLTLSDYVTAEGSYGTLSTQGKPKRNIYSAAIRAERKGVFSLSAYAEHTDAALLLYSPYLADLLYTGSFYKFSGSYRNSSYWQVAGYFKYITLSDNNKGNELQFRFGKGFFDEAALGYEYMFTNYDRPSPIIPFTNRSRQLYYSPQNLESHGVWVDWTLDDRDDLKVQIGAKVAYLPLYKATTREFTGDVQVKPLPYVFLSGIATFGSTIRFDTSYTYISLAFSLYVSLY